MSLFKRLSGRSGEDISTEVLAHLLSSEDRYVPFRKLLFNRIFSVPPSSVQVHVETQTQAPFKFGRPDMIILAGEAIIVLENKLGAYLSGDNQLVSYCKVFDESSSLKNYFPLLDIKMVKKRALVFLAPRKIIDLSVSASDEACKKHQGKGFFDFLIQRNIIFSPLPWEEVLGYLDLMDSLQYELYLFVRDYINQELTQEERMILQNPQVPSAILKLFKFIDELRNNLSARGWSVGRMSQSAYYFGFQIETEKTKLFFGYFLLLWEDFKTPIFLQVREEYIKEDNKDIFIKLLKDNSFIHNKEYEFIRPFKVDSIESWKDELIDILQLIIGKTKA